MATRKKATNKAAATKKSEPVFTKHACFVGPSSKGYERERAFIAVVDGKIYRGDIYPDDTEPGELEALAELLAVMQAKS